MPRALIALVAALAWLTVGTQFILSIRTGVANGSGVVGGIVSYFGYFTLLTNILCAAILTAHAGADSGAHAGADSGAHAGADSGAHAGARRGERVTGSGSEPHALGAFLRLPAVASTAATAIIIVGVVYHLLLAALWNPQGIDLVVDTMLHTVLPILFVLFWWQTVPRGAITLQEIPRWASYPAGYAIYAFVRGEIIGEYPYPFIDVASIGYGAALRNSVAVAVVFLALAAVLVGVNRIVGVPRPPES
jgi:hypothetical protein